MKNSIDLFFNALIIAALIGGTAAAGTITVLRWDAICVPDPRCGR